MKTLTRSLQHINALTPLFKLLLAIMTLSAFSLQAADYRLFIGEMKTLKIDNIERVAVGNAGLVSTSILDNGSLLVLGEQAGDTELQIWLKSGKIIAHKFYVTDGNLGRLVTEIKHIIGNSKEFKVEQVGSNIVLKGTVPFHKGQALEKITSVYPNVINLATTKASDDLAKTLSTMTDVSVSHAGANAIVSGRVSSEQKAYLAKLQTVYPQMVDATITTDTTPMVYMNVKITEFSNKASESLGIGWGQALNGPEIRGNTYGKGGLFNEKSLVDYTFGMAYELKSMINLAINSGDALLLASPTLSALSGENAKFLAGGEFPIAIPDGNGGTSIEYKEYGVILNITPTVDHDKRITVTIETEVSSLDSSVSVGGAPGLKKRKTSTVVSLNQGETFAISGLINREMSKGVQRLPFLSKIPILGHLFQSNDFIENKSDMVIFITPQIVDAQSEINKRQIAREQEYREQFKANTNMTLEIIE